MPGRVTLTTLPKKTPPENGVRRRDHSNDDCQGTNSVTEQLTLPCLSSNQAQPGLHSGWLRCSGSFREKECKVSPR